jgi:hypothetical protein
MFALDLFNNDHERRLAEGAVDQLEQRRIDDLAMKMDDLVARAKDPAYKKNPAALSALMKEFKKCKDERDSYYKVRNETMGYGTLAGEGQVTPVKGGIRHHAKPENYGGYQPEPELKGLNKTLTKNLEKGMGIEFKRAKKFGGGIEVDEAGIPGNVPTEKIPGKEDLLKGKGRSYYESVEEGNPSKKVFKDKAGKPVGEIGIDPESSPGNGEWYVYHYGTGYSVVGFDSAAEAKRELIYVHKHPEAVEGHPSTFDEAGIPGNVPADKIPGKEDLLKGKGRSYYEADQKKNFKEVTEAQKLHVGDPVIVTAPNEFEGKTGEVAEFSPSGKFVVVNLYNHGEHSMHLSDVEYNQYADEQEEEDDDWYDDQEDTLEGWSNKMVAQRTGQAPTPYSVYIKGKEWKSFADDDHAENIANKLRAKFKQEGKDPSVITIAPTGYDKGMEEAYTPSPAKPFRSPRGFNKQGTGLGNKLAQLSRAELANIQPSTGTPVPAKDFARGVLKDLKKVNVKEAFIRDGADWDDALRELNVFNDVFLSPDIQDTHEYTRDPEWQDLAKMIRNSARVQEIYGQLKKFANLGVKLTSPEVERLDSLVWDGGGDMDIDRLKDLYAHQLGAVAALLKTRVQNNTKSGQTIHEVDEEQWDSGEDVTVTQDDQSTTYQYKGCKFAVVGEEAQGEAWWYEPGDTWREADHYNYVYDESKGINRFYNEDGQNVFNLSATNQNKVEQFVKAKAKDFVSTMAAQRDLPTMHEQGVAEVATDYSKRRQRERDVDAGRPVARQRQPKMTDYQKRRAQDKKDMALGEDQDTSGVERAILNRIMVAHTDLLMKFGPEKVMQAAEEVAYNVGDVDEIGTSDVSAYVHQVKQILGVPEELDEKWSQKYKSSINCANPKGFSQRAHCAGKKK